MHRADAGSSALTSRGAPLQPLQPLPPSASTSTMPIQSLGSIMHRLIGDRVTTDRPSAIALPVRARPPSLLVNRGRSEHWHRQADCHALAAPPQLNG